ncbi:hypothetical protein [Phenylobacterium sp.]|uniref:hypothetical protein n=1 Tax=Phenylobacterium sp. TaxID=1871053 RepID=UPI0025FE9E19|nr:hypothetical protein [Phenylobacterium sp.]MCA3590587.1 hypothetical protein [Methylocystis sp.]MCA6286907.1 hypothetical protein [Phenylobacterium sp.]MCA6310782.1 hypothetical protein [Phenylobacterium sp.]MCA6323929.1 hypothetical protein [Phenylobacterium sp.]MCA6336386.1 hypothetical protein [Phenylobacterium sp.]
MGEPTLDAFRRRLGRLLGVALDSAEEAKQQLNLQAVKHGAFEGSAHRHQREHLAKVQFVSAMELALGECRKMSARGTLTECDLLGAASELLAAHRDALVTQLVPAPDPAFASSASTGDSRADVVRANLIDLQGEVFREYELGMYTLPGDPSSPVIINVANITDSQVGNVQQSGANSAQRGNAE